LNKQALPVQGRVQTSSYDVNGETRYATKVVVNRHSFRLGTQSRSHHHGNRRNHEQTDIADADAADDGAKAEQLEQTVPF